jgi:hypothetical protein
MREIRIFFFVLCYFSIVLLSLISSITMWCLVWNRHERGDSIGWLGFGALFVTILAVMCCGIVAEDVEKLGE